MAHELADSYRPAAGYVGDGKGNILLVKTHHRGWEPPGGQIEMGETIEQGLLREIFEESGIVASVRALHGVYSNVGQHLHYDGVTHVPTKVLFEFLCDYVSGTPTPSEETSEVAWVPLEKALEYITARLRALSSKKCWRLPGGFVMRRMCRSRSSSWFRNGLYRRVVHQISARPKRARRFYVVESALRAVTKQSFRIVRSAIM